MSDIVWPVSGKGARADRRCMGDEEILHSARMLDMLPGSLRALEGRSEGSVWPRHNTPGQSIGWPARKALPLKVRAYFYEMSGRGGVINSSAVTSDRY